MIKRKLHPISTIELSFLSCATMKIRLFTKKGLIIPVMKGLKDPKGANIADMRELPIKRFKLYIKLIYLFSDL